MLESLGLVGIVATALFVFGIAVFIVKMYRKVEQGKALVRTGLGGVKVAFNGIMVVPAIHRMELMDISVKRIEISRLGKAGLVCKDNIRADIKVAFFVRVNQTVESVSQVAGSLGCERASLQDALVELFDAKFSEALKTVGKKFNFEELYEARVEFKREMLEVIGRDLNGYVLEDAAIDYLEQTPLMELSPDNILDADGIKKITDRTAAENMLTNNIRREEEKVIKKQDVEAREAILQMERQLAETEQRQQKEIAAITAREQSEAHQVEYQEMLKAEQARIRTEEEVRVAEQNRDRQVIVAERAKQRTDAVESERVEKDRLLEKTEKEKIVSLAEIEKQRAVEEERKNIQEVIRQRVMVEKAVVEEEERIKDTRAKAAADREKLVAVTKAQEVAEEAKISEVVAAEAAREAARLNAERKVIDADADRTTAEKRAEAMKTIADARAEEEAVLGLSEVRVMEARALAIEKEGGAEARVIELKAGSEAKGIREKAEAMKEFDGVGREHEEFKLRLNKEKEVELAGININKDIALAQAEIIRDALSSAKIDIIGGETMFFENIVNAVSRGKALDRMVDNSSVLQDLRKGILGEGGGNIASGIRGIMDRLGVNWEDVKNISVSALLTQLMTRADSDTHAMLSDWFNTVKGTPLADQQVSSVMSRLRS